MKHLAILIGVPLISTVMSGQGSWQATRARAVLYDNFLPTAERVVVPIAEERRQLVCAYKLTMLMARRDKIESAIVEHAVEIEPAGRIRVFFVFNRNMAGLLPKLGTMWKFPKFLGGRFASACGQGEPGFEIHLDPRDESRTVDFDAHKSSDVDDHAPAGDLLSILLHFTNVVQHRLMKMDEKPACELLREMQNKYGFTPEPGGAAPQVALGFSQMESGVVVSSWQDSVNANK